MKRNEKKMKWEQIYQEEHKKLPLALVGAESGAFDISPRQ